jgi:hypothetical protein
MPARPPPAKGGARPGSGRKLGAATLKTREVANKAATDGITPLEVMVLDMRGKYEAGDLAAAADRARDCAPYMHPRLSSANVSVRRIESIREISDGELAALTGTAGAAGQGSGADGPDRVHQLH